MRASTASAREFFVLHLRPWIASVILAPICVRFAGIGELDILRREVPSLYRLLDNLTLVTHEAGHFVFSPFGDFMTSAGGTLMQIILPSVLVWHFLRHEYRLGVQLSLMWLGQSFISAAIYAADGRKRILPLLGDNLDGHDWHNMLHTLGMLEAAPAFGHLFRILYWSAFLALVLAPLYIEDQERGIAV